jgi:capsular exopolysaccharide synthesis family protein
MSSSHEAKRDMDELDQSGLPISEIIYALRRHQIAVILTLILFIGGAVIVTLVQQPRYESTATIMVDQLSKSLAVFDVGFDREMNLLNNEMELIKSRSLAEATARYLWDAEDQNNLFIFGTRVYNPRGYRRLFRTVSSFGMATDDTAKQYFGEIPPSVLSGAVSKIRGGLSVTNQRNTNVLKITVKSQSSDEAALLANSIIQLYALGERNWTSGEILNLKQFLLDQLTKTEDELKQVEDSLRAFQEKYKVYQVLGSAQILLRQLSDIEADYFTTIAEKNIVSEKLRYLNQQLSFEEQELVNNLLGSMNSKLSALRNEIGSNEGDLIRNETLYGENHDIVISLKLKLDKLKNNLEEQTNKLIRDGISTSDPLNSRQSLMEAVISSKTEIASNEAKESEYSKLVKYYNLQLSSLPWKTLQLSRLERDRSVLSETYSLLRQKYEEARINQASQLGKIREVDLALPPGGASSPNARLNILVGLLLAVGFAVAIPLLMEYFDFTINSIEEIEKANLALVGIIPAIGSALPKSKKSSDGSSQNQRKSEFWSLDPKTVQRRLIIHEDPKSPIAEAYRSLRTNVIYSSSNKPIKSILVSSPGPGEGKTTTICNLAIAYANLGKRTLLIDTDLRKPVIHKVFESTRSPGITDYLSNVEENFEEVIQETSIPNLSIVPAGISPPNPSELLGSERMRDLVAKLEEEWDMVLFDSPPMVAVTDATLVSKEIDGIIIVVKAGGTDKRAFRRTLSILQNVEASVVGAVFNGATGKSSYGSYSYYYQNYYYYHA